MANESAYEVKKKTNKQVRLSEKLIEWLKLHARVDGQQTYFSGVYLWMQGPAQWLSPEYRHVGKEVWGGEVPVTSVIGQNSHSSRVTSEWEGSGVYVFASIILEWLE